MVNLTIILLVLYFLQFYLASLRGKDYFAKLNQKSRAEAVIFWPLEAGGGAARKKTRSRSRLGKNQEPEPLEKK